MLFPALHAAWQPLPCSPGNLGVGWKCTCALNLPYFLTLFFNLPVLLPLCSVCQSLELPHLPWMATLATCQPWVLYPAGQSFLKLKLYCLPPTPPLVNSMPGFPVPLGRSRASCMQHGPLPPTTPCSLSAFSRLLFNRFSGNPGTLPTILPPSKFDSKESSLWKS